MNSSSVDLLSGVSEVDYSATEREGDIAFASETIDVSRFTLLTGLTSGRHDVYIVSREGVSPTLNTISDLPDGYLTREEDSVLSEEALGLRFPCSASELVEWWERDAWRYVQLPELFVAAVINRTRDTQLALCPVTYGQAEPCASAVSMVPALAGEAKVIMPEPVTRTAAQDTAILSELREAGYEPLALPKPMPGKPGVKAEIRRQLMSNRGTVFVSRKVFDNAWQRLRDEDSIMDEQ